MNGPYKGQTLRDLYNNHRELFGHYKNEEFPIIVKYIDAKEDLSIQVHPDNDYALKHENSLEKEECWYILDAKADTEIIIGHREKTKDEIRRNLNKDILNILNYYPIKANDYFYIPQGTVHAICHDTFLIEVSQSNDITYRFYDYDRLDHG
jgi:mannose-6-phosphate isomerase